MGNYVMGSGCERIDSVSPPRLDFDSAPIHKLGLKACTLELRCNTQRNDYHALSQHIPVDQESDVIHIAALGSHAFRRQRLPYKALKHSILQQGI